MGLECAKTMISGAAPISMETLNLFMSLGLPLCETYGMSETTGPHTLGTFSKNRCYSVGPINELNHTKIRNKDEKDGTGEVCMKGRHVFMGYLNDEAKTAESFDEEGYLRSGDIGTITDEFLFITGRLKELIITAGGENIAPTPIEASLKAELPNLISNSILIGDRRKYLSILVTLKAFKLKIFY